MRAVEAHQKCFSFLSSEEDRELSDAMLKIREKIENLGDAVRRKSEVVGKNEMVDPALVYAWWERNFDEAFTRQSRQATEMEANWSCIVTGKPELATFKAEFEVTRTVKPQEIEQCFERLWDHTAATMARRRERQSQSCVSSSQPKTNPERKISSPRRLSSLSQPKYTPVWDPPSNMTFEPQLAGGRAAKLRQKMTSSLPPIDITRKRPPERTHRYIPHSKTIPHDKSENEESSTLLSSRSDVDGEGDEEDEGDDDEEDNEEEDEDNGDEDVDDDDGDEDAEGTGEDIEEDAEEGSGD